MSNLVNWQQEEPTDCGGERQLSVDGTSRVSREAQARICERLGVRFPGATRPSAERMAVWETMPATREASCLFIPLEVKIDFNIDGDVDFLPIFRAALEFPLLDRPNCVVGESKWKPTNYSYDVHRPVLLDNRLEDNCTAIAGATSFGRILRCHPVLHDWWNHSRSHVEGIRA